MACNPTDQLANASCFICLDPQQLAAIQTYLLCQIQSGGGTGGGGGLAGVGSPEGVVTANPGTTYLDTSTGGFWAKLSGTGNTGWIQLIA